MVNQPWWPYPLHMLQHTAVYLDKKKQDHWHSQHEPQSEPQKLCKELYSYEPFAFNVWINRNNDNLIDK